MKKRIGGMAHGNSCQGRGYQSDSLIQVEMERE